MANPAAQTALGPMVIVALEQHLAPAQRVVDDPLASQMLPAGMRLLVRLARWRPARDLLVRRSEQSAPGIWGGMLCRKRYIDDQLQAALGAVKALVVLGAGLDTHGCRLSQRGGVPVFEVDLPENIAAKRARVQRLYGRVPELLRLVPVDFERQDTATALAAQGYRADRPALFIWEGVSQYLTEAGVRATFDFLARAAPSSRLVFTYVRQDFLDGANLYGAAKLYQQFRVRQVLWRFGLDPARVSAFLAPYGWREQEQLGSQEAQARYLRPRGRALGVSELERSVCTLKL